jgi:hypothetical protein
VGETTTTIPTNVQGEQFERPVAQAATVSSAPLATTGSNTRSLLFWAGLALALGGLAALFGRPGVPERN